jgi:hypothetical protein
MRRLFYVALGATVGVIAMRKVSKAAARWTPEGIAAQAGNVGDRLVEWWTIVQDSAAARERELRESLGIDERPEHPAA